MESIKELLSFLSEAYNIEPNSVSQLAKDLNNLVENPDLPLSDVVCYVEKFEQEHKLDSSESQFSVIMDEIIDSLPDNETNANRLFALVVGDFEWYSAIQKLLIYNIEYLTETQKSQLLHAAENFDTVEIITDFDLSDDLT